MRPEYMVLIPIIIFGLVFLFGALIYPENRTWYLIVATLCFVTVIAMIVLPYFSERGRE